MIFYFSATGNSQYIAQRLAEVTGETLVSITECLKNHKYTWELLPGERVGFVTPVYFFGLPSIVSEFIRNLDLCVRGQHFVYHVVTFGTITGQSHYMMEKALRKKGLNLDGRYIVKMVDTYTLMFDLSDEEKCEKVTKDAEVCIDRVIEKVVNRVRGDLDKGAMFAVFGVFASLSGIRYSVWEKDNQTWSVRPSGGKDVKIDFDTVFSVVKFLLF